MDIKIGFTDNAREIALNVDEDRESLLARITAAVNDDEGVFELTDAKGTSIVAKNSKIAWIQLGSAAQGRVGFNIGG
ncbi:DUF3107 domain-containing protein [Corynebacterium mendelii]|uniref:DUF3107 domain-containing protein n=1 Tax=Corynebacterium mendelii TaxID=2765362 RepID=A0A939IXG6_9CORY|nr:DUF3107 domain-containing protein [Corynebacterium mendelii]